MKDTKAGEETACGLSRACARKGERESDELSGGRYKTVLDEHLYPARCITLYAQGLIVHHPIPVGSVVLEHREEDAQNFVRQRHNGFLVPFAKAQGDELVLQRATTVGGSLGKLTEQSPHPGVAFASFSAFSFSCALVVARTVADP